MFKVNSKIGFIIILCVTIASIYPLFNLRFNFDMNKFFPVGDPDLEYYQQFKQKYHSEIDDEYIFIGLRNENGIFDQKFLKKVAADFFQKKSRRNYFYFRIIFGLVRA